MKSLSSRVNTGRLAALALGVLLCGAAPAQTAADFAPKTLLRFGAAATDPYPGRGGFAAPVYNPVDGYVYGVTLAGVDAGYGSAYRFKPGTAITGYSAQSLIGVGLGFGLQNGLVVDAAGTVYSGLARSTFPAQPGKILSWKPGAWPISVTGVETLNLYPRGVFAVDPANNLYFGDGAGRATMRLYRLGTDGVPVLLVDFSRYAQGSGARAVYLKGQYPGHLLYSQDNGGTLYGFTIQSQSGGAGDAASVPSGQVAAGTLFRIKAADFRTDGSSEVEVLHTFASVRDGIVMASDSGQHGLVEDGEWLYGTTTTAIYRYRKNTPGSFALLHVFGSGEHGVAADADGVSPRGTLVRAADGHIYGTTQADRSVLSGSGTPIGSGSLFRIKVGSADSRSDDAYEQLHRFTLTTDGGAPQGLSAGPVDAGVQTLFGVTLSGGAATDTVNEAGERTGNGTVFAVSVAVPLAGKVEIGATPAAITIGQTSTLSWTATHASACVASGAWTGSKAATGTEVVTPAAAGSQQYTLSCTDELGAAVTATAALTVNAASGGGSDSGGGGGGAAAPWLLLAALGLAARRRSTRVRH